MNLIEAFDFVAAIRPTWKAKAGWNKPFIYNRDHALRLLGKSKNVKRITKADLAMMRNKLMSEGRRPGGVNRILSMTLTLLKELEENEIITKAPKLKALPENNERTAFFSRDDIDKMVSKAREMHFNELADAILFAVFTGCRQGELLDLLVGDVELTSRTLTFRDTKNGTDHELFIHDELLPMLQLRCEGESSDEPIFQFTNKDQLYGQFKKVRKAVGLGDELVFHSLRHTTGSWLAEKGVAIQTIAKVLNHKQISTSMRYTHLTLKVQKEALEKL